MTDGQGLWVFGYGSLMWRPGFTHALKVRGRVHGYSRRLCVLSVHHRGTEARPGLVLGLDRGGVCDGMLFFVPGDQVREVLGYLAARELVNGVYREAHVRVRLAGYAGEGGRLPRSGESTVGADQLAQTAGECGQRGDGTGLSVRALTYIAERAHPSYTHALTLTEQARIIAGARGRSGANIDYVLNTAAHLRALGIRDDGLERLVVTIGGFWRARQRWLNGYSLRRSSPGVLASVCPYAEQAFRQLPSRLGHRSLRRDERRRYHHRLRITG